MGQRKFAQFTNELGNIIHVEVEVLDPSADGVRQVRVVIDGPDSRSEDLLTIREAQELRLALGILPDLHKPEKS